MKFPSPLRNICWIDCYFSFKNSQKVRFLWGLLDYFRESLKKPINKKVIFYGHWIGCDLQGKIILLMKNTHSYIKYELFHLLCVCVCLKLNQNNRDIVRFGILFSQYILMHPLIVQINLNHRRKRDWVHLFSLNFSSS